MGDVSMDNRDGNQNVLQGSLLGSLQGGLQGSLQGGLQDIFRGLFKDGNDEILFFIVAFIFLFQREKKGRAMDGKDDDFIVVYSCLSRAIL